MRPSPNVASGAVAAVADAVRRGEGGRGGRQHGLGEQHAMELPLNEGLQVQFRCDGLLVRAAISCARVLLTCCRGQR